MKLVLDIAKGFCSNLIINETMVNVLRVVKQITGVRIKNSLLSEHALLSIAVATAWFKTGAASDFHCACLVPEISNIISVKRGQPTPECNRSIQARPAGVFEIIGTVYSRLPVFYSRLPYNSKTLPILATLFCYRLFPPPISMINLLCTELYQWINSLSIELYE